MGKKSKEMSQVYSLSSSSKNEFIFGENGGKGKNLSSFLKNLSLTRKEDPEKVNTNIYGSLGSGSRTSLDKNPSPHSFLQRSVSDSIHRDRPNNARRTISQKYADLDDDWDADIDEEPKTDDNKQSQDLDKHSGNNPPIFIDSLYPDLTISSGAPISQSSVKLGDNNLSNKSMSYTSPQNNKLLKENNQSGAKPSAGAGSDSKIRKFKAVLESPSISLSDLRQVAWNGVPKDLRAVIWQLLLGYLPTTKSRQSATLVRKRQEYAEAINSIRDVDFSLTTGGSPLYHQINIDVKRTNPSVALYGKSTTQQSLRKILYLWAIRHPASGYVQGINDLATPFFQTFLDHYLWQLKTPDSELVIPGLKNIPYQFEIEKIKDVTEFDPKDLPQDVLTAIEADTYWCLSRLLDNITDNYIPQQPGIIRQVQALSDLISKIDPELSQHLESEGVQFLQFAFRWMNCLLMRELSMQLAVRMWDTYLSETPLGFNSFHVYVCAAFLVKFADELKKKDFQEIILFLQNPPTQNWGEKDVELMLSEAFIWQSLYKNASAHLR